MRLLPYGDRAVLVELGDPGEAAAWSSAIRHALHGRPGVVDVVPAARTVLVVVEPGSLPLAQLRAVLGSIEPRAVEPGPDEIVEIPVHYDGADLGAVAAMAGLEPAEVVQLHSAAVYTCAFCGFAPGFAYLTGLDVRLQLPRRATPRPKVPKGSVAIAAEYCGIYPNDMPGGWHLLGRTDAVLWDLGRADPALITPGTHVRFRPIDVDAG